MLVPGTTVPVLPVIDEPPWSSVLVTLTSFCGVKISTSLALAGTPFSVTVTVLLTWPTAAALAVAVTVYTTLLPGARLAMLSLMAPAMLFWPLPLQTKPLRPAGTGSLTLTLVAVLGPLLWTV